MKVKKLVCGVGINDADYTVVKQETTVVNGKQKKKLIWICPFYQAWKNMVDRCYSIKFREHNPTYIGCTVTDEWLTFSVFKNWMMTQDWKDNQLDKDLLFEDNKVYGPETCVFVTQTVNKFTNDHGSRRGEFLIGVYWNKASEKFMSQCRDPFTKKGEYLGLFDCEQEAHKEWLKRKLELAYELADEQPDERVAEALIDRYSNYKTHN